MLRTTSGSGVQSWSGKIKEQKKEKKTCRKDVTSLVNLKHPFQI